MESGVPVRGSVCKGSFYTWRKDFWVSYDDRDYNNGKIRHNSQRLHHVSYYARVSYVLGTDSCHLWNDPLTEVLLLLLSIYR